MTSQHSPTPWKWIPMMSRDGAETSDDCNQDGLVDRDGTVIMWFGNSESYYPTQGDGPGKIDAARIIACVNACAGIPADELHMIKIWRASHHQNLYREGE